jgi:hypothetical protein
LDLKLGVEVEAVEVAAVDGLPNGNFNFNCFNFNSQLQIQIEQTDGENVTA